MGPINDDLDVSPALREGPHLNTLEKFQIIMETRQCHYIMIKTPMDPTPILSSSSLNTQHYNGHLFLPAVLWYFRNTGERWPLPVVRVIPGPSIIMLIQGPSSHKKLSHIHIYTNKNKCVIPSIIF